MMEDDDDWFEDSDMGEEDEAETSNRAIKQEPQDGRPPSVESQISTITLSSDDNKSVNGREEEEGGGGSSQEESEADDAFDAALIYDKEAREHEFLKEDVKMAARDFPELERELGIPSVEIQPPVSGNEGTCSVALTLNISTDHVPEIYRHLWELGTAMTVTVVVDGVHKREFRAFEPRPIVLARKDSDKPSKFPVGECLVNIATELVTNNYTLRENRHPREVGGSFFSMLYEQLTLRLKTLTEWCMVCGAKLHKGGLLPTICERELCQYQYQELGLHEGLTTPRVSAPVLSLLLMAFNAAVHSGRWRDILTPAPAARNGDRLVEEMKQLYKKIDKKWSYSATADGLDVHSALGCVMPCAHQIMCTPSDYAEFKRTLPSVAEFIEWLVISNQSYMEVVPKQLNVDFLHTPHQFLFVADTPQKQAEFDALVQANGGRTRYLFQSENWHSIIRSGLKNMSGTKYQLVGAVHGAGIYLSNQLSFSFGYSTPFDTGLVSENCVNNRCCMSSVQEGGMMLLAVVEVVDTPAAYRYNQHQIVVVQEEKWCSIRMLVAYTGARAPVEIDLNQLTDANRKKIRDVVHMFKTADITERAKHA